MILTRIGDVLTYGAIGLLVCVAVFAVEFSCEFKASCTGGEVGLLRAENYTGGYNNAHAQLMNYSGSAYAYTLCCDTDVNHTLDNDCSNENATIILKAITQNNSHTQVPTVNTYAYDICMALSPGNVTCEYVNSTCSADYNPVLSIASSEENSGLYNQTNAHIGNYSWYTLNVCCQGGNARPTVPVLLYPVDDNQSVFERNITFDWAESTDPDGDAITYDWNLTSSCDAEQNQPGLGSSTYESGELRVDCLYNWSARACDTGGCSAWAETFNFTIASVIGITLQVNNTNFGELAAEAVDNTTDGSPPPFLVRNTGNVNANVTIKADDPLFETSGLGNNSFQYKARVSEAGAYDSGQESWTNVSASFTALFTNLYYTDSNDEAFIDILVRLPATEGAGVKSSTINVTGEYTG